MAQRQNPDLVKKYGIRGYPSTVIARPSGEEVKRFGGYQRDGVDAFLEKLDAVAAEAGVDRAHGLIEAGAFRLLHGPTSRLLAHQAGSSQKCRDGGATLSD